MRQTVSYDYEPFADPAALLKDADVVVLGHVDSVESALLRTPAENTGGVVVGLAVDETWKSGSTPPSDTVYYVINRPTNVDISAYQDALPKGTRIVLFGYSASEELVEGDPGTDVYDPAAQGLFFEVRPSDLVNVWGAEADGEGWKGITTVDELRAATLGDSRKGA